MYAALSGARWWGILDSMKSHEAFGAAPATPEADTVPDRAVRRMLAKLQHENGITDDAKDFAAELARGETFGERDVLHAAMELYENRVADPLADTARSPKLDESYEAYLAVREELKDEDLQTWVAKAYRLSVEYGLEHDDIKDVLRKELGNRGAEQQLEEIMVRMYMKYGEDAQSAA